MEGTPRTLANMFNEMPHEIQRKILSYLDIDTRRAMGVYTKLGRIPVALQTRIHAIPKPVSDSVASCYAEPGIYLIEHNIYAKFVFMVIYTNKNDNYGLRYIDEICR